MLVHLAVLALVAVLLNQLLLAGDLAGASLGFGGRAQVALLALARVGCVAAPKRRELSIAQLPDTSHGGIQKGSVVRSDDQAAVAPPEVVLQPLQGAEVEVVRRLVKQQQLRIGEQQPGQDGSSLFAAGQEGRRSIPLAPLEAEAGQRRLDPLVERVAILDRELVLQVLVLRFGHPAFVLEPPEAGFQFFQPHRSGPHGQPQAGRLDEVRVDVGFLRQQGDGEPPFTVDLSAVGLVEAGHESKQGRFTGAVRADEADAIAGGNRGVHVVEDDEVPDLSHDPGESDDRHQAGPPTRAAARRAAAAFCRASRRRVRSPARSATRASSSRVRPRAPSPSSSVQRGPRRVQPLAAPFRSLAAAARCSAGSL